MDIKIGSDIHEAAVAAIAASLLLGVATELRRFDVALREMGNIYPPAADCVSGLVDAAEEALGRARLINAALDRWESEQDYGPEPKGFQVLGDMGGGASR